ncbi:MAG: hypothetical protein JXB05_21240 [Myxococcaceae bacterium]|nr:hypothetical protein [Myxococcaceae bacterium]
MNDWLKLHGRHRELRATGGSSIQDIRRVLQLLTRRKHAALSLLNRFTNRKNVEAARREWHIAAPQDAKQEEKKEWSEPLQNLDPSVSEARLTLLALTDESDVRLSQLTIMLSGKRATGDSFAVAAHLDDCHKGMGACGHALFHCHVGPDLSTTPKVRVPLPALRPAAALEWVLSVVLPNWEPVPWSQVVAHFARKRV